MSKLDLSALPVGRQADKAGELINELCPNLPAGRQVEWKRIGKIKPHGFDFATQNHEKR